MIVRTSCCLCDESAETEVETPANWNVNDIDVETALCPKHASIAGFISAQCPGCVGGWTDCGLWTAFAYSHGRDLTPRDFDFLKSGKCPRRVNGTMSGDAGGFNEIDISTVDVYAGEALASAIKEYWKRYP